MNKTDWNKVFAEFDWDTYFAKLNAADNVHAFCDHGNGYCAATVTNVFEPKGAS